MDARSYRDGDGPGIDRILCRSWPDDPSMREVHSLHGAAREQPWRRTLVVESRGELVAAGTLRLGERHPARFWLALNVSPSWRRQGIASRLLGDLRVLAGVDARPFRAHARPEDEATMEFLRKRGFRPRMRSAEGIIDPRDPAINRCLAGYGVDTDGFRIVRRRRDHLDRSLPDIALFYEDWYRAIHAWDPPVPWSVEKALHHFCGRELVKESVTCVYRGQKLHGVGSLIELPLERGHEDEVYLVQLGVLPLGGTAAEGLMALLVSDMVRFAASVNKTIRFEVDDTHPDLWRVLHGLPLASRPHEVVLLANDREE